jgi:hypothetical protein
MPAGATKSGPEFLVNTSTTSSQLQSTVVGLANARFVAVWFDGSAGDANIRGQIFNTDGTKFGAEFLVNTTTAGAQQNPAITALQDGGFAVVFDDLSVPGGDIRTQIFNADGTLRGTEFIVNTPSNEANGLPEATILANGNSVVVWRVFNSLSDATHLPHHDLHAQIIAPDGSFVGPEFVVIEYAVQSASEPAIAGLANGEFVVAWNDGSDINAQRFDSTGNPIGAQLFVTATTGNQREPAVTALSDGRFVVGWTDAHQFNYQEFGSTVRAQIFNPDGSLVGTHFRLNTLQLQDQSQPKLASLPDGRFVAVWTDASQAGGEVGTAIHAQVFGSDGLKVGTMFFVNTTTFLDQDDPNITVFADGRFAITWTDESQSPDDPSLTAVRGQIFDPRIGAGSPSGPQGTPGDDTIAAPSGSSQINGGAGIDTITFNLKLTDVSVSYVGNQVIIDGPSSHTVLTGFEKFAFADGTVDNNDRDPLVDDLFYYSHNHDVWNAHADADAHFHTFGWREFRDPSAFFDTDFYLALNVDVRRSGADPQTQFDQSGWKEGRIPSPAFDPAAYLAANPDVKAAGVDPLAHFLQHGAAEGRQPFAVTELIAPNGFDYIYYLQHNPDVAAAHVDPLAHFSQVGWKEGRNPNALFDTNGYLATYADVKAAGVNPLDHYHQSGWHEGRDPSVNFDTTDYLANYPDIAAANIDPLAHFLRLGIHEGRSAVADGVWG